MFASLAPSSVKKDKLKARLIQSPSGDNRIQCAYLPHSGLGANRDNKTVVLSKIRQL
jgi:hypothetical protein